MAMIFEFYDRFEFVLRTFLPVVVLIFVWVVSKLKSYISNTKIKRVLSLTKNDSIIIVPVWEGKEIISEKAQPRDCILYEEAFIIGEIKTTVSDIHKTKFPANFIGRVDNTTFLESSSNHFYFGGYAVYDNVHRMLRQHCNNVKFPCDKESHQNHRHKDILYPCELKGDIRDIKIGDYIFTYDCVKESYVILIKLTNKALKDNERGTVHICFGNSATGTFASARCFNNHRVELYNRLKKRKTHYFAIMKCYNNGEIDFTSFRDYTDEAFSHISTPQTDCKEAARHEQKSLRVRRGN